jgi:hypothetical protein
MLNNSYSSANKAIKQEGLGASRDSTNDEKTKVHSFLVGKLGSF